MLADVHVGVCEDGVIVTVVNVVPSIIGSLIDQLYLKRNLEEVERRLKEVHLEADRHLVSHRVLEEVRILIVIEGYRTTAWDNRDEDVVDA